MMNLPFTKFKIRVMSGGKMYENPCQIMGVLDEVVIDGITQPLVLIFISPMSARNVQVEWWTGVFVYEEGIGGRAVLDTNHMKWIHYIHAKDITKNGPSEDIIKVAIVASKNNIRLRNMNILKMQIYDAA